MKAPHSIKSELGVYQRPREFRKCIEMDLTPLPLTSFGQFLVKRVVKLTKKGV